MNSNNSKKSPWRFPEDQLLAVVRWACVVGGEQALGYGASGGWLSPIAPEVELLWTQAGMQDEGEADKALAAAHIRAVSRGGLGALVTVEDWEWGVMAFDAPLVEHAVAERPRQEVGLSTPKVILDFISDCCVAARSGSVSATKLYDLYLSWHDQRASKYNVNGALSQTAFGKDMSKILGKISINGDRTVLEKKRSPGCMLYSGIAIAYRMKPIPDTTA